MIQIETARQIGAAVRKERKRQGLTQQQLANVADVSRALISRLEKGAATALYPEKLLAVLDAVGLSLFIGDSQTDSFTSDRAQQTTSSRAAEDADRITPELRKSLEFADELQKKVQPNMLTGAQRVMAELAEHGEKAAMLQKMMQPSMAKIAEQLAAATANADFLKTSPLIAQRKKNDESSDRR